jgi:hypothetical protein
MNTEEINEKEEIKKIDFGVKERAERIIAKLTFEELKKEYIKEKIQSDEFRQAYIGIINNNKFWNLRLHQTTGVEIKVKATLLDHNFSHVPFFEEHPI